MSDTEIAKMVCLAKMAQATAWINMTAAQAQHDMVMYEQWRCAYDQQAGMFQSDFDKAGRELAALMSPPEGEKP